MTNETEKITGENGVYSALESSLSASPVYSDIKIFDFKGRIGRLRYFTFSMFFWFIYIFGALFLATESQNLPSGLIGLAVCFYGACVICHLSFVARRLHDTDCPFFVGTAFALSVIWIAFVLSGIDIPKSEVVEIFVGSALALSGLDPIKSDSIAIFAIAPMCELVMYLHPGTKGENKYGAPPQANTARSFIAFALALCILAIFGALTFRAIGSSLDFSRGKERLQWGDYNNAIMYFSKAIKRDAKDAAVYYNRGYAYNRLGDFSKAIADFTEAIEIDPKYTDAYYYRGNAYKDSGDYDKAIADFTKAIEIDPKNARSYNSRGFTYHNLGDYDKEIADFTEASGINPEYTNAYVGRGFTYHNLGDYDKAIADFTQAIRLYRYGYPYNYPYKNEYILVRAYGGRAAAYAKLGDLANAAKDAETACGLGVCESLQYMQQEKLLSD
jgi:tetratricopeptide (TPR) repeat protein